jgi:hypothetical protein
MMLPTVGDIMCQPNLEIQNTNGSNESITVANRQDADWDTNVAKSRNAAEMRTNVLKQYPGLGMEFTLNDRIATYFPAAPAAR